MDSAGLHQPSRDAHQKLRGLGDIISILNAKPFILSSSSSSHMLANEQQMTATEAPLDFSSKVIDQAATFSLFSSDADSQDTLPKRTRTFHSRQAVPSSQRRPPLPQLRSHGNWVGRLSLRYKMAGMVASTIGASSRRTWRVENGLLTLIKAKTFCDACFYPLAYSKSGGSPLND
jgi:hypothetical protein